MNLLLDLDVAFPTEQQKYAAMIKFSIFGLCLNILHIFFIVFLDSDVLGVLIMIYGLVNIYIALCILYKARIFAMLLKIFIGFSASVFLSFLISMALVKDAPAMAVVSVPVIALISLALAGVANRKRWAYVKRNFRYVWIFVIGIVIDLILKITFIYMLHDELYRNEISRSEIWILARYLGNLLLSIIVIYFYKLEEKKGERFYDVTYKLCAVPITLAFLMFSWITIFVGGLFHDNVFLNDGNVDFSGNDLAGTDFNNADLPDADIAFDNHFTGIQDTDFSGVSDYSGVVFPNGFETPAITGLGVFSAGNTLDFGGATINTTIDIPEFHSNPYMLFTTHSNVGNFNIADANGMTQISVVDGNVYDATHTLVGGLKHDDVTGITTLNSNSNEVVMSWDQQNNIYAGTPETGHLVGRVDKGVGANTLRDMSGGIVSYTDALGNAYGANGTPLGSVRKI